MALLERMLAGAGEAPLLALPDLVAYSPYGDGAAILRGGMPTMRLMFSCEPIFRRGWTGSEAGPELSPLVGGRPSPAECSE